MLNSQFDFEQLLQPISPNLFFSQYWRQRPLHISRNNSDYYSDLISVKDIDTLLQFGKPKYPRVKLGKNNKRGFSLEVLEGMQTTSMHDYGVPNLHRLYNAYTQGDTLLLYKVETYWEPLAHFCRHLEQYFSCLVNAALFLTPKEAQGFPPHFDPGDMFILQVEGSKVWRIYNSSPLPFEEDHLQPFFMQDVPVPEQEICLAAGDFLYIPRGCVHEVATTDAPSLHLSVAANVFTWADLIISALASVNKLNLPFHKALPVGFLNQNKPVPFLQEHLIELLEYLSQNANAEAAVAHLARRFVDEMQPLPDGHFSQLEQLSQVNLNSVVKKRQGMVCWIFKQAEMPAHFMGYLQDGDQVSIQFPGSEIRGPAWIEPALHFIAETEAFAVCLLPDILDDKSKLVLVRRLIREGFLQVVELNESMSEQLETSVQPFDLMLSV